MSDESPTAVDGPKRSPSRLGKVVVNLNVGGTKYSTMLSTLCRDKDSPVARYFTYKYDENQDEDSEDSRLFDGWIMQMADGSFFIDRDANMFRYILDYLRTGKVLLPERFAEIKQLKEESSFYQLNGDGYITIGYRGSFAFGRDGQADVKFRKVHRILVSGKATLCRDVFGDTLNESRDPDREGSERYTARLYLKHQSVEKAFDCLLAHDFRLQSAISSGANGTSSCSHSGIGSLPNAPGSHNSPDARGSVDNEENRWARYSEFVFARITK